MNGPLSQAAQDVLAERRRQIYGEGWTKKHDAEHDGGELACAGAAYALAAGDLLHPQSQGDGQFTQDNPPSMWPPTWRGWWKPGLPRRMLIKATALLLAEIERGDREGWPA